MKRSNDEHSHQYRSLLSQLCSHDMREKCDSMQPNSCLDKMYDWERADAELSGVRL